MLKGVVCNIVLLTVGRSRETNGMPRYPPVKSHPIFFKKPNRNLCRWLSYFVVETGNCKGEKYSPKTLYQILCGLLQHGMAYKFTKPSILQPSWFKKTSAFKPLHNKMDKMFK